MDVILLFQLALSVCMILFPMYMELEPPDYFRLLLSSVGYTGLIEEPIGIQYTPFVSQLDAEEQFALIDFADNWTCPRTPLQKPPGSDAAFSGPHHDLDTAHDKALDTALALYEGEPVPGDCPRRVIVKRICISVISVFFALVVVRILRFCSLSYSITRKKLEIHLTIRTDILVEMAERVQQMHKSFYNRISFNRNHEYFICRWFVEEEQEPEKNPRMMPNDLLSCAINGQQTALGEIGLPHIPEDHNHLLKCTKGGATTHQTSGPMLASQSSKLSFPADPDWYGIDDLPGVLDAQCYTEEPYLYGTEFDSELLCTYEPRADYAAGALWVTNNKH